MVDFNDKLDNYLKEKLGLGIKEIFEKSEFSLTKNLKAELTIKEPVHGDIYIETYISKNMNISILKEYSSLFYKGKYVDFFNYIGFELKGLSMQQDDYGKKVFLCHVKDFVNAVKN